MGLCKVELEWGYWSKKVHAESNEDDKDNEWYSEQEQEKHYKITSRDVSILSKSNYKIIFIAEKIPPRIKITAITSTG